MKLPLLFLLGMIPLMAAPASSGNAATYRSDYAGKRYDFEVTHAQVMASPDWADDAENPPLAARKALELAHAELATLLPDAAQWKNSSITLQPLVSARKWVYLLEFHHASVGDGPVDSMRLVVLMDGTVVKPRVSSSDLVPVPVPRKK
jgi:hypothetical protein